MTTIRLPTDTDSGSVINIIESFYKEYEGCVLLINEEEPELKNSASAFSSIGGNFWVAQDEHNEVVGTIAVAPADAPGSARIQKLYVTMGARGCGLGVTLCSLAEKTALNFGADWIMLYTDTRFVNSHRLYEPLGYTRLSGEQRRADASNLIEFLYSKPLK